jgi:fumarate hydratase class II
MATWAWRGSPDENAGGATSASEVTVTKRIETDALGPVEVDADRYWGAETQRSLRNFEIGVGTRFPRVFLRAYGLLKKHAARVNARLGLLDASVAALVVQAAEEVARGDLDDHFPLVVWQTGSGTQTHMNVNEVIAGRANEIAGRLRGGKKPVDPHDHVNRGQSSNDTFPTAMHVAVALSIEEDLLPAVERLVETLRAKAAANTSVIKIGRTHLQDATPLTLGQEMSGWAAQLAMAETQVRAAMPFVHALAIGGTAVGTGLNTHPAFADGVVQGLREETGLPFTRADDACAALAGHEPLVFLSGALSSVATALMKVANDVRLLASGPRCGIGELALPENEPGSSIMPGKVNPTQVEAATMVCCRVMGNHTTIAVAAAQGHLELNVYKPVIVHAVLESVRLLSDAVASFELRCVRGLESRRERIAELVQRSLMLVTALTPHVGHDAAASVARQAHAEGTTLREAALALGVATEAELDVWLRPEHMLGPSVG